MFAKTQTLKLLGALAAALVLAPAAVGADEVRVVRGLVVKADPAAKKLTIRPSAGPDVTLTVTDASRLAIGKKDATLKDVAEGKRVRATYTERGGMKELVVLRHAVTNSATLRKEVKQALTAAKSYTFQQKDKYEEELNEVLADVDDRIDQLEDEAKDAGAEAKAELQDKISRLKKQRTILSDRLGKVKSAGAEAWDDIKSGVNAAGEDLEKMLEDLFKD
jgi:hypothetical protein